MILWHKLTPRGTRNTIKKYSTHVSRASFQAQASLCVCVCMCECVVLAKDADVDADVQVNGL